MTHPTYGLVLLRWDGHSPADRIKVLVIKRRCSYPFGDFVEGRYDPRAPDFEARMKHRFSLMTSEEKSFIDCLDYNLMHFKYWLIAPNTTIVKPNELAIFRAHQAKFVDTFVRPDNGARLQSWLRSTAHINMFSLIEFPKGRAYNSHESQLAAAQRETLEETGIHPDLYEVLEVPPIKLSYVGSDDYKTYNRTYFIARMKNNRARTNISHKQRGQRLEVDEIDWLDLATLELNVEIYKSIYRVIRNLDPSAFQTPDVQFTDFEVDV